MPTTIVASDNTVYHLFQLSAEQCAVKDYSETIWFSELENDLSDGYDASVLFGSATGNRKFSLTLPTLTGSGLSDSVVIGINGETTSREEYIWNLFCECKVTGTPFVIQSSRNSGYFLVKFAQKELTYQRMLTKLYSTGLELKQSRQVGKTVYDPAGVAGLNYWYNNTSHASPDWNPVAPTTEVLDATGDVLYGTATQNGLPVVQFNSVGVNGRSYFLGASTWTDIFLVMKVRTATFARTSGVLCEDDGSSGVSQQWLLGESGTTKFSDVPSGTSTPVMLDAEYRLNGVLYPLDNMQAPMQTWGIVHLRFLNGNRIQPDSPGLINMGWNGGVSTDYAEIDVAEFIGTIAPLGATNIPMQTTREITEFLQVKWSIT
jgi:hypothetical protein